MFYRRKTKGFFYYFKTLLYTLIAIFSIHYLYSKINAYINRFDADKILEESVLKNKTFSAEVKEIESEDIKAYLMEEHSNPIVSIDFEFENSGYAFENEGQSGISGIASQLIKAGAGKYDEKALVDLLEENGIKISFNVSKDVFSGSMSTPKSNLKTAQYLLRQIILYPRLPLENLNIIKAQKLRLLQLQQENPNSVLSLAFNEKIYGNHPYSRNPIGKKEDIEKISVDDIRTYLKNTFDKQSLIIAISGDIDESESQNLINEVFGSLPNDLKKEKLEKFDYISNGREFNIERDIPQVIAVFSAKGTYRNSEDFYPLYVANYILGESGLTSKLNKVIREENGLTYGIYSFLSQNDSSAIISGSFSSATDDYEEAKKLLLIEWKNMAKFGISEQELEKAKKSLIDSFNLRFADIGVVSNILVAMQKYNLGIDFLQKRNDYIRDIKLEDVNAAAEKYFSFEPDFVTIGIEKER